MFNQNLVKLVVDLVKKEKLILMDEGDSDLVRHNFSKKLIMSSFLNGIILEDKELYPENPNLKHKGKNYYCINKYKESFLSLRTILISFIIKNQVIIFHVSPLNYGSREERFYRKNIQKFKELFHQE